MNNAVDAASLRNRITEKNGKTRIKREWKRQYAIALSPEGGKNEEGGRERDSE